MPLDPYHYASTFTRRVMEAWIAREPRRPPVFAPLSKPLSSCRVALVTSAALALRDDLPFDQAGERANPWWGDPSFRVIPQGATERDIAAWHLHTDPRPLVEDLDCALPTRRLAELIEQGVVGSAAPRHLSFMGYHLDTYQLELETAPLMLETLRQDDVDAALLAPS